MNLQTHQEPYLLTVTLSHKAIVSKKKARIFFATMSLSQRLEFSMLNSPMLNRVKTTTHLTKWISPLLSTANHKIPLPILFELQIEERILPMERK